MAFSFRISSFDFNLFDFMKRNLEEPKEPKLDQPPTNNPPIINDSQSDMLFDMLSGIISNDKQIDTEESPAVLVNETESNDVNLNEKEVKPKPETEQQKINSDIFDNLARDILKKFKQEYSDVRQKHITNISYQLSHTDMLDNKAYINRFQDNVNKLQNDEERHIEKEKEKSKDDDFLKRELRKQKKEN